VAAPEEVTAGVTVAAPEEVTAGVTVAAPEEVTVAAPEEDSSHRTAHKPQTECP
jgi:hypothetical protein